MNAMVATIVVICKKNFQKFVLLKLLEISGVLKAQTFQKQGLKNPTKGGQVAEGNQGWEA